MNLHVSDLLAAYHDGELASDRRHQVEKHLQDCVDCRAELESFAKLSALLKADSVPHHTPPQRFAAQVQLRLPRALPPRALPKSGQIPRWALGAPLALIIAWAFLQAALKVTFLILRTDQVFGDALFNSWITTEGLFETSASLLVLNTAVLVGTVILWSAWMAFWLAWQKNKNETPIKGGAL